MTRLRVGAGVQLVSGSETTLRLGRYVLGERLAAGGMEEVSLAVQEGLE